MILSVVDGPNLALGIFSIGATLFALYLAVRHIRELRRAGKHIEVAREKTEELRRQMLVGLQLHDLVVRDPDLERYVRDLSTEFGRLLSQNDPLQLRLARREVERATQLVRMGAEGHLMIGADSFADAETLASIILDTVEKEDEFWASSLVDSEFWAHAAAYVRQQQDRIEEDKVKINRVFVFDSKEAFDDPHAQRQMRLQQQAKINVKYVIAPRIPARDVVVVRKRYPEHTKSEPITSDVKWTETYALECKVGADKRIEHIDLWSLNDLQSEMVRRTWWNLQSIFSEATPLT